MDAPAPATPGPAGATTQPCPCGACMCILRPPAMWSFPVMPCHRQESRGSSGSFITLMKGDAWQASIRPWHLGGGGGVWFLEPPSRWLPVPARDYWALRGSRVFPCLVGLQTTLPSSRPQFPPLHQGGWNLYHPASVLCWGARRGGHGWNSFFVRGLRVPRVRALPCQTHLGGGGVPVPSAQLWPWTGHSKGN